MQPMGLRSSEKDDLPHTWIDRGEQELSLVVHKDAVNIAANFVKLQGTYGANIQLDVGPIGNCPLLIGRRFAQDILLGLTQNLHVTFDFGSFYDQTYWVSRNVVWPNKPFKPKDGKKWQALPEETCPVPERATLDVDVL